MGFDMLVESEHAKLRDLMLNFLKELGKLIPNQEEFSDTELGDYIVDTLREQDLTEK